jgi:hypothetical protein
MEGRRFEFLHEGKAMRPLTKRPRMELKGTTTVAKPPEEVHGFWSSVDRFPSFMAQVDDVRVTGPRTSHWKVSAPFDREVEWDAETTERVPGVTCPGAPRKGPTWPTQVRSASCVRRTGPARRCT